MNKLLVSILLLTVGAAMFAGEPTWVTDMTEAKKIAARDNKTILINFTGSDWCGWCKRLDREVFSKEAFVTFAEQNLVLVKVDFPKYQKLPQAQVTANYELMNQYAVSGFPTIFLVDAKGKKLLSTGYLPGGPQSYVKHLSDSMNLN